MAINYIYPFGQNATSPNILSDAGYQSDGERTIGNQPGIARQELVNKALRNDSALSSGLAQFVADNQSVDIHDSLTPNQLSTYIHDAITKKVQSQIEMPLILGLNKTKSGQPIPSGAVTPINWQHSIRDTVSLWNSTSPADLVIPSGVSLVRVHSSIGWDWSATAVAGNILMNFQVNGAFTEGSSGLELYQSGSANKPVLSQHSVDIQVAPGDIVHIVVEQTTGSTVNIHNNNFQCNAAIEVIQ